MMSAKVSAADIAAGRDVGADDYIGKPFSIKDVIRRIQALLSSSEIRAPDVEDIRGSD